MNDNATIVKNNDAGICGFHSSQQDDQEGVTPGLRDYLTQYIDGRKGGVPQERPAVCSRRDW